MPVEPSRLPYLPDFCWPVDTSCIPRWDEWRVVPDPNASPPVEGVPYYSEADKARAISMAGQTLRVLTGFRVGGCPVVVRPCRRSCSEQTWRTYPVAGGSGSTPWHPVSLGGRWLNVVCGHGAGCRCSSVYDLRLDGMVGGVVEVKIDGMVLDPSAYRLEPGGVLVRLDGEPWPTCQNMHAPDTEPDTFSVSYVPGAMVDGYGAFVAGILTAEYLDACTSGDCRLPTGVTQIVRQGVTMTLTTGAFPDGLTGIREVDAYVRRWNPHGLASPSLVVSPDTRRHRVTGTDPNWLPGPPERGIDGGTP